ncbi:MAG TPA: NAD(P)-dependent oxidoreductase, partial [Xanthomonadales bacterium]|nr:NAD(P)-dependent oxidoreductase [Xanthomonadales bacterium]
MRVALFGLTPLERDAFAATALPTGLVASDIGLPLTAATVELAARHDAVCCGLDEPLDEPLLARLAELGVHHVALRGSGYNTVDLAAAARVAIGVSHVPDFSPHAVAEHTLALILSLARDTHFAWARVREGRLEQVGEAGLLLAGATVGVVGAGRIGRLVAKMLLAFDCRVLVADPAPRADLAWAGARVVGLETLLRESDVVTLHCPLDAATRHLVDAQRLAWMKPGAMLVNTGRGALLDLPEVVAAVESGRLGRLGIDVYEQVGPLYHDERGPDVIDAALIARLARSPRVLVTNHQGYLTRSTLAQIAAATYEALDAVQHGRRPLHGAP